MLERLRIVMYNKVKQNVKAFIKDIWNDKVKKLTFLMYVGLPILITVVVEALNQRSVSRFFTFFFTSFDVFIINLLIVYAVFSFVLLLKKRIPFMVLLTAVFVGFSIANYIVRINRETPLNFTDLKGFAQIMDIFDKYLSDVQMVIVFIAIALAIAFVVFLVLKTPKYAPKLNYIRNGIIIAVSWIVMLVGINLGQAADRVSEKFPNMTIAYQNFGFIYSFTYGMVNVGVDKPVDYKEEGIVSIVEQIEETQTVDEDNVSTPNIIFLQLESFIDLSNVKDLVLNKEATPNFTRLKKEYPSGYLTVNNVGYGTANTEFEVICSMNLEDFGPGEFPCKTILKETTCESVAYVLRDYGYVSHAMHNNTGTFYSRNVIFKNLGFDTYTSLEYMNPTEFTPKNWVKDKILTDEIIKVLDSTEEPDYLYAISVQGHGSYPTDEIIENPEIQIVSGIDDDERYNQMLYYANQIYEMDEFINELTEKLADYDEEVILVMYGDHLPGLGFTEEELINGDLYQTEYVIWSNYGFDVDGEDMEAFQITPYILQALNIDGGVINKFHQVYKDDDDYLKALNKLTYDILYGDKYVYGGKNPYAATDLQMGTYEIKITDVYPQDPFDPVTIPNNDGASPDGAEQDEVDEGENIIDGWVVVKGKYFTPYSHVFVNEEKKETIFIDENTLLVRNEYMKSLDEYVVKQMWKSKTVVSTSESYMYIAPVEDTEE